jgi:methyl-accepting chemotaxis protein
MENSAKNATEEKMKKSERRKIVMINKRFQLTLILRFLIVNVALMLLSSVFLYLFLNSEIEANLHSAHVMYQNMGEMLLPIIVTISLLNVIISSTIITLFVLYTSFRIAGPLYRFNTAIREITKGNLTPLMKLRDKDELTDFSISLQEMAECLIDRVDKTKEISSRLKELNKTIKSEELNEISGRLDSYLNAIRG